MLVVSAPLKLQAAKSNEQMTKLLYVAASALCIGLVWFFSLLALFELGLGFALDDLVRAALLVGCVTAGAVAGWKLFVSGKGIG